MTISLAYWILMLLWLIFGLWATWPAAPGGNYHLVGGNLLLFVLMVMLGWKVFGAPLHE